MVRSIAEVLAISKVDEIEETCKQFDKELTERLEPLEALLTQSVLSQDITSIETHMAEVESWRARLVKFLSLATALVERAKSSAFLPEKSKSMTELDRDAFRRKLSGGFTALVVRLEGLVDCVDSRCNLCKKILYTEAEGFKRGRRDV